MIVRPGLAVALASAALLVSTGCPSVIPHTPNERMVDNLGPDVARSRLGEVIARAIEPRIASAEATDAAYIYRWNEPVSGPYGIGMGQIPHDQQVHYANVGRIEIYENGYVYIYTPSDVFLHKFLFASVDDAKLFADLVSSFRARGRGAATPPG